CSSLATAAIAALPSPWRGMERVRPTSPRQVSRMERTEERLEPLRFSLSPFAPLRPEPTAATSPSSAPSSLARVEEEAPAPWLAPPSAMPSMTAETRSSSAGYSCSARSYLRAIGQKTSSAMPRAWATSGRNFFGTSGSIMVLSFVSVVWGRLCVGSDEERALKDSRARQVAVPALVVELLDEAVAAEQLHTARTDPRGVPRDETAGLGDRRGGVLTAVEPRGRLPHDEAEAGELDGDVRDGEGDGLAVPDGLAEGLALLDVLAHVVEHRLGGADGRGSPREAGTAHGVGMVLGSAEEVRGRHAGALEVEAGGLRGPDPHGRVILGLHPLRAGPDDDEA